MEDTKTIVKAKIAAFFCGCVLKKSGVIVCTFKTRPSNFETLLKIVDLQKAEADLYARIGANSPRKLGRFVFDKCIIKGGEGQLSFSSVREAVEMQQVFSLPLPDEDMSEFDLLCNLYKIE